MASTQGTSETMPIAVVGIGCRLPGGASTPEKLWDLLVRKQSALRETPSDRFNIDGFHHPHADRNGTLNNRGGHFLDEDISAFDAPFFSISPAEALSMDPMQRILLEVVYEATESAGIPISTLAGTDTSCYVGCFTSDYDQISKRDPETLPKYHAIGTGQAILSNRVSFCFDLKGPSVTLDTACSSSLVAVHLACQSLRTGESKTAIVGATHAILNPDVMVGMTNLHFLSPDSRCHTFDERANGYSRGEGMAALILKPLSDAIRDGDTVRAVIRGTAVNANGKAPGITLPSRDGQARLIRSAYEQAGCDPLVTAYVEAHGTGTAAGDPIEAGAIGDALGAGRPAGEENKLFVGSVKTNIGHLEGASGLAALVKVIMSLEKGIIAPNLWFEKGNPAIDFDGWRIRVPTEPTPWPVTGLRRASVNGFGYGGTNGHVILDDAYHFMQERGLHGKHNTCLPAIEESINSLGEVSPEDFESASSQASVSDPDTQSSGCSSHTDISSIESRPRVFYLSGHESASVVNGAKSYAEHIAASDPVSEDLLLDDLAYTLSERRTQLPFGSTVVASSRKELIDALQSITPALQRSFETPGIGFVFTGQGAQWWAMGRELLQYPVFAESISACDRAVASFGSSWSLLDELRKDQKTSRINEAEISQPLCSALQIALVDLYASWNIHPDRVIGHSSGEIAAAYATGALTLESAMCVAYFRGLLSPNIKSLGYKGGMMAAGLSEEEALADIEAMGTGSGKISVACVNSPRSVTLSGDLSALTQMQRILTSRQVFARRLQVETAYHSHHMLAIADQYRQHLANLEVRPWIERKQVAMFSSVTARVVTAEDDLAANYWVDNMVSCVRFSGALTALCNNDSSVQSKAANILIELGPHSALAGPVKQILSSLSEAEQKSAPKYLSAVLRGKDAAATALTAAGILYTHGCPVDMHCANFSHSTLKTERSTLVDLPTYSWNRTRKYWAESRISRDYRFRPFPRTDILGAPSLDWNPMEPRWRNIIRLSEQPWVRSHVVQGAIVYPAAGYCCMALQAAAQMSTLASTNSSVVEYKIRDLSISRALVVPQTDDGVEVIFSMRPDTTKSANVDSEFRIFSYTATDGWAEHCHGSISTIYKTEDSKARVSEAIVQEAKDLCQSNLSSAEVYAGLDASGLYYGPEFQGIVDISFSPGNGRAFARVQVTDTASTMPEGFEYDRLMHPATMDSFLQMSIAAVSEGNMVNLTQPYVPTWIEELTLPVNVCTTIGTQFQAAAESKRHGSREVRADVCVVADNMKPAMSIQGLKLVAIASASQDSPREIPSHTATAVWEADVDLLALDKMNNLLRSSVKPDENGARLRDLEMLAYYFFDRVLSEIDDSEIEGMHAHHQKFVRYMRHQRDMVLAGTHEQQTTDWLNLQDPQVVAHMDLLMSRLSENTDYEGRMFVRMGKALTSILRKEVEPLALMMKDNLLHDYYTVALGTQGTYPQIARYVSILSHKYPDLDYLEIGAGTGGCTTPVLEALSGSGTRRYPRMKSYTYTDISSGFFEQAAEKFSDWTDMMEFAKLDIERDPDSQPGFENRRFDVIVAANVLHATYDMDRTIKHARKLLRPNGKLVLLDMTHSVMCVSLIFGNLSGWWNCSESWREYGPLLSEDQWRGVLLRQGFSNLQASSPDAIEPLEEQTRVIVATAVEPDASTDNSSVPKALIVAPSHASGQHDLILETVSRLERGGFEADTCTFSELNSRNLSETAVISFAELEDPLLVDISVESLATLQRLIQDSPGLIWVTRGGIATKGSRPELSLFQGLARSLRAEKEGTPCITLDLDSETSLPEKEAAALITRVFEQNFSSKSESTVADREFSEEGGLLRIKRAIENSRLNQLIASRTQQIAVDSELQDIWQSTRPLRLKVDSIGAANSLVFDGFDADIALPDDYVQIDVKAANLNSRDASVCLGEVTRDFIGSECAGVVTKIGSAVTSIGVGARVAAWCSGSISTVARCAAAVVQEIPDKISFSAAASLPLASVTAYHALVKIARLREHDSILIHSAFNAVGQASVQIAKLHGARVFATVSSDEEKTLLTAKYGLLESQVFVSGDESFADSIRQGTSGRGVDIVLNNLAGDTSDAIWKTVSSFGRFIEVAKRVDGIPAQLEKATLARNVSYTVMDISAIVEQDETLAAETFAKVMDLVRAGSLQESSSLLVKPFSKIGECIRLIQDGKKDSVIVEPREGDLVSVMPKPLERIGFVAEASYLLAGGLGGLGRSISRWMVQNGARNLIFVSRSGASTAEATELIRELTIAGARIEIIKCDVTDEEALKSHLSKTLENMPPLRGVIQGAMALKDQVFSNMSYDAFTSCLRPKVQGSRALHHATLQSPLDFFVLLSSCASFWGNAGQSNYAAGCNYQVALAAHRRSLGLPATAIDIGKVANVGFVAENAGSTSERNLVKLGLLDISEDELLCLLEMAMQPSGHDSKSPGHGGNMPNGHLLTGVSSSNDPSKGSELPFWSRDPVFAHMDFVRPHVRNAKKDSKDGDDAAATQKQQPLPVLLSTATSTAEADAHVLDALLRKLSRSLLMPLEEMDAKRPTSAYGVDSLIAVELRNWLSREAKVDMPVFEILQASSLEVLANKVTAKSPLVVVKA